MRQRESNSEQKRNLDVDWQSYLHFPNKDLREFLVHDLRKIGIVKAEAKLHSPKEAEKFVNTIIAQLFARLENKDFREKCLTQSWYIFKTIFRRGLEEKLKLKLESLWKHYSLSFDERTREVLAKILLNSYKTLEENNRYLDDPVKKEDIKNKKIAEFFKDFEEGKRKKEKFQKWRNVTGFIYTAIQNGILEEARKTKDYFASTSDKEILEIPCIEQDELERKKENNKIVDFIEKKVSDIYSSLFYLKRNSNLNRKEISEELNLTLKQFDSKTQAMNKQCKKIALKNNMSW